MSTLSLGCVSFSTYLLCLSMSLNLPGLMGDQQQKPIIDDLNK